jgi:RND family efflux transporter MFP subunit
MKKTKLYLTASVTLALIVGTLLYNKSKMEAESRNDVLSAIPVSVVNVNLQNLSDTQYLSGTIEGDNDVAIISETQGRVTGAMADVGDRVRAGSIIVTVDDELKQAALSTAEVNYQKAQKDLERFEALVKQEAATDQQVEASRLACKAAEAQFITARREFRDTKISTPIAGVITSRHAEVGTYIQKGMTVANVIDVSRLKVKLNVAEHDAFRMKAGDTVDVTTSVYPGVSFVGTIHTISAKGDDAHTYPVEVVLNNSKDHPLRGGMFATVVINPRSSDKVLTIPRGALLGSLKKPQVYVISAGVAHLRDITAGPEVGTDVEILSGLREGETIVVNGQNNLKDGVQVAILK